MRFLSPYVAAPRPLALPVLAALLLLAVVSTIEPSAAYAEGLPSDLGTAWQAESSYRTPPQAAGPDESTKSRRREAIRLALNDSRVAGATISAIVYDFDREEVVFEQNADLWLKPASNTKVLTTGAAIDRLGIDASPVSRVGSAAELRDGHLYGDLILFGDHDLSWSVEFYPSSQFVVRRLIQQLVDAGITDVHGDLVVRGLFVVSGQRFGDFDQFGHASDAAELFRRALTSAGIRLYGGVRVEDSFELPESFVTFGSWTGVPLSVIVSYINRLSHNEHADAVARWLGHRALGISSYESAFVAIRRWADELGIATDGLRLYDGSGLSHDNRVSARVLLDIHRHMLESRLASLWMSSLSAAGVYGTYAHRMTAEATQGRAFFKSGTINGVITGSGILLNRWDHHRYITVMMMNDLGNQHAARLVQDEVVEVLARDWRALGAPPQAPMLRSVSAVGQRIVVDYQPASDADRCDVWVRGLDGADWTWIAGRPANVEIPLSVTPPNPLPVAYRVTCANDAGTGEASDAYLAAPTSMSHARRVLLVDANDRWVEEPAEENELRTNHEFLVAYGAALNGASISSGHHSAIPSPRVAAENFDFVVWAWGEQGADWSVCDHRTQRWFEQYAALGGSVFASGSEAAWQICEREEGGRSFLETIFGAEFVSDDAGTRVAEGTTDRGPVLLYFLDPHGMFIGYPDVLKPAAGATSCARYLDGTGREQSACVFHTRGDSRTVMVGFPVESIVDSSARARWLRWMFDKLR